MGILILITFFNFLGYLPGSCQQAPVVPLSFSLYSFSLERILLTTTGAISAPEFDVLDFVRQIRDRTMFQERPDPINE